MMGESWDASIPSLNDMRKFETKIDAIITKTNAFIEEAQTLIKMSELDVKGIQSTQQQTPEPDSFY